MKTLVAVLSVELLIIAGGAAGDRMFSEVPTWALGLAMVFFAANAIGFYLWDRKDKARQEARVRELLEARDMDIRDLKTAVSRLPQRPLGEGHTYAELPNRTNIVTMADGSMRLALPSFLSAAFEGGLKGELNATVELEKRGS